LRWCAAAVAVQLPSNRHFKAAFDALLAEKQEAANQTAKELTDLQQRSAVANTLSCCLLFISCAS
jgi:hypothetical protein